MYSSIFGAIALAFGFQIGHLSADHAVHGAGRGAISREHGDAARGIDGSFGHVSKARVSSASPARMAVASPNFLWQVGLPRRKSSLSSAGRSS